MAELEDKELLNGCIFVPIHELCRFGRGLIFDLWDALYMAVLNKTALLSARERSTEAQRAERRGRARWLTPALLKHNHILIDPVLIDDGSCWWGLDEEAGRWGGWMRSQDCRLRRLTRSERPKKNIKLPSKAPAASRCKCNGAALALLNF